jgi:uncharacterized membrane protein
MTTITRAPGIVLGLGLGGFLDGVVLNMLLGWHHMLSGWYPLTTPRNIRFNTLGDGLFQAACLGLVIVGIIMLARAGPGLARTDGMRLFGWIIAGWGVFNLVEGLIAHFVLSVHHVRHGDFQNLYDIGFLGVGALFLAFGGALGHRRSPADLLYAAPRAWG